MSNFYERLKNTQAGQTKSHQELVHSAYQFKQELAAQDALKKERENSVLQKGLQKTEGILTQLGLNDMLNDSLRFLNERRFFKHWQLERIRGRYVGASGTTYAGDTRYPSAISQETVLFNGYRLYGPTERERGESIGSYSYSQPYIYVGFGDEFFFVFRGTQGVPPVEGYSNMVTNTFQVGDDGSYARRPVIYRNTKNIVPLNGSLVQVKSAIENRLQNAIFSK